MHTYRKAKGYMKKQKFDAKKGIVWVLTVMVSITVIFVCNRIVAEEAALFAGMGDETSKATVVEIIESKTDSESLGTEMTYENTSINFKCELESGSKKGKIVEAQQTLDSIYAGTEYIKPVEEGDRILLIYSEGLDSYTTPWQFSDYYRLDKILMLVGLFAAIILLIGRWKGVNTLLSLGFTFCFVFLVFAPAVMAGYNAYLWSGITCIFTIIMTLLLINSTSKKTLATIIGCVSGTVIAALGTYIMSNVMKLTGYIDEHSYYLTMLDTPTPIDLKSIIFAAIIIGAMGAIMDVAMDLASSLYELSEHVPDITFKRLWKSGMSIGRDIMGTMANTLVLAYIGSSLSCIMILLTFSTSAVELLSKEVIIVEMLQATIGSLAILLTVPCTIAICGVLYLRGKKHKKGNI